MTKTNTTTSSSTTKTTMMIRRIVSLILLLLLFGLLILSSFVIPVVDSLKEEEEGSTTTTTTTTTEDGINNGSTNNRNLVTISVDTTSGTSTTTTATKPFHPKIVHMTIARPFSVIDLRRLSQSFDSWDDYIPCNTNGNSKGGEDDGIGDDVDVQVNLLLVYSRSLEAGDDDQEDDETLDAVLDAIDHVKKKFRNTNGWNSCISSIDSIGVNIDPTLDIYNASQQDTNPLWVNGPNRHFERTIRYLQNQRRQEEIDVDVVGNVMYWMEMDSVPVKDYWLDALVKEVQTRQASESNTNEGFAILGRYGCAQKHTVCSF